MSEAPDIREQEDCPAGYACDYSCDQHEIKTVVSGWSMGPGEILEKVTKAVGSSLGGWMGDFEPEESNYATPGRISVAGKTEDGKEWWVELALTKVNEVDNEPWGDGDDDEESGDE
jgi:hypothetical protein